MKVIAAYLLAVLGGNANPSAEDINKILGAVGAEADETRVEKLVSELHGKNIEEIIAAGKSKLASVPTGGAGAAAAAPAAAGAPAAGGAAPAAAAKKEEEKPKKEEKKEESDEDMGFGLFD